MPTIWEQIKNIWRRHQQKIAVAFFLVVFSFLSFGLGYRTAKDKNIVPIVVEKCSVE